MQTLDGNADRIKAYTVAVYALNKPHTFDPKNNPSVRVLAKRVRYTLKAYYTRTYNRQVVIFLQCGSYAPSFIPVKTVDSIKAMKGCQYDSSNIERDIKQSSFGIVTEHTLSEI